MDDHIDDAWGEHCAYSVPRAKSQPVTPLELYERLQEQHEASMASDRARRAESRAIRRHVASQPKRLVVLDNVFPPGSQGWVEGCGVFEGGLPREWVGSDTVNRLEARRA